MEVRIECVDENCKGIVTNPYHNGLICPKCGGPALPKPVVAKEIPVTVKVDITKVLSEIKELTEATNECVASLSKLETVMGKFSQQVSTVELYCDGKLLAHSLVKHTADNIKISANVIKGVR
ncbi:hypothetical protein PDK11_02885 [Bacillus cereus]|nr:hypothetical protein [Bacillus cereus]